MKSNENKIEFAYCEDADEIGYKFSDLELPEGQIFASHDAASLAHDLVDHQFGIKEIGTIRDEASALGGSYINSKFDSEYQKQDKSTKKPIKVIEYSSDLVAMAINLIHSDELVEPYNRNEGRELEYSCEYFEEAIIDAESSIRIEFDDLDDVDELFEEKGFEEGVTGYLNYMKHHFSIGAELASSKYDSEQSFFRKQQCISAIDDLLMKADYFKQDFPNSRESVKEMNQKLSMIITEDHNGTFDSKLCEIPSFENKMSRHSKGASLDQHQI